MLIIIANLDNIIEQVGVTFASCQLKIWVTVA